VKEIIKMSLMIKTQTKKRTLCVFGALLTFLSTGFSEPTLAQNTQSIVNVRNAGAFTCDEVVPVLSSAGREIEKTAFLQWTAAYATAASRSNSLIDVFPLSDTSELVRMTDLVCREQLTVTYETALRVTIRRLQNYWIRQSSEILVLSDPGGRTVLFYEEAVQKLQIDLQRAGISISDDGLYGNQTGNAIRSLNEENGLSPWLTPDGTILYLLTR
jgi:hypothetical protein